jgi:hypothetical protein
VQFDVLNSPLSNTRAQGLMRAVLEGGSGLDIREMAGELREDSYVVLYGLGGRDRVQYANRDRLIAFDAGYWDRKGGDRKYRVAIGGFHSPQFVMRGPYPGGGRWASSGMSIGADRKASGPILLVGNGPKSNAVGADGWTAAKSRELREAFPDRKVVYRPKPKRPMESGVVHAGIASGAIDDVLRGASLVVCRHSNVAVDACRIGVPVVCDDGAAAAIYPQRLEDAERQPSFEQRTEFLHRLAWWQWSVAECRSGAFWGWMTGILSQP